MSTTIDQDTIGTVLAANASALIGEVLQHHPTVMGFFDYSDYGVTKENKGLIGDAGAWDGHMDNYAEWIKQHPESDESREDYDREKDIYYQQNREMKEQQRIEDEKIINYSYWD